MLVYVFVWMCLHSSADCLFYLVKRNAGSPKELNIMSIPYIQTEFWIVFLSCFMDMQCSF